MPDFSTTCEASVEYGRQFLQRFGACTPEVEQRLKNLEEVTKILSGLIQNTAAHIDPQWLNHAKELCKTLLFGGAMKLIITQACHSNFFNQVEESQKADETSKLPLHMQRKVEEITGYLKKCQVILDTIDKIILSLIVQVDKAKNTDFNKISDEDRKTLGRDVKKVESELQLVKTYLDSAQVAFNALKSDVEAEKWHNEFKVSLIATGCLATLMIGGVALYPTISQIATVQNFKEYILGELGTAKQVALGSGFFAAATYVSLFVYYHIHSYGKILDDEVGKVESHLRQAKTEYNVQETRFNEQVKE